MDWTEYRDTICTAWVDGHTGLDALGRCECGRTTPCCNQAMCERCAKVRGVCPFCAKKNRWTPNCDASVEVPLLRTMLAESQVLEERVTAIVALREFGAISDLEVDFHRRSRELAQALDWASQNRSI